MGNSSHRGDLRIGVFVCHCGSNIAGVVNCKRVTQYAAALPGVVYATDNLYTCSEAGIAEIRDAIVKHNLNRVVVASCSPRTHMPLFKSACAQAGLNPYLFEMVNIRDQCSWVHMREPEKATAKAMDLVRMGVAKAAFLEPQEDIESSLVKKALVIGGGVAGLSAAEAFGDMGIEVILIERENKLGGLLNRLNLLAPEMRKAEDLLREFTDRVVSKSNVRIFLESEIVSVDGVIGNYNVTFRHREESVNDTVGCIVVATGSTPISPEGLYGYDGKRIITQLELEERLKRDVLPPSGQVVMIQCAGARCSERPYCSRICCITAVKNAIAIKEAIKNSRVYILYRDIQMYGTEYEGMLWNARRLGIHFDVYDPSRPPVVKEGEVEFYRPMLGESAKIPWDLVVLSTPLAGREDATTLSRILRIPIDQNRFFLEAHAKLRPLDFATDGIFVCGSARYPTTVEEARAQGLGAASRAATILFKEKLVSSALVAEIDARTCVGCQGCLEMCPYGAICYNESQGVCEVNTLLCKGCGNCASTCPSHSVTLKGFTPNQMLSQIKAAVS